MTEPESRVNLDVGDEPLLVFGGPYSNLEATQALLAEARRRGIPGQRTVCTGDVVAYGADPEATVTALRQSGARVVMGNCEEALASGAGDCGCGFAEGSRCQSLAGHWYPYALGAISPETRRWMAALPRRIDFRLRGLRCAVVHGSPSRMNAYLHSSTPPAALRAELERAGLDGILAGHSGIPFTRVLAGRFWHNAGAIGLPANDGTPRVWYSIVTAGAGAITLTHHALTYDHQRAAGKMTRAGLPVDYATALRSGLWPSCDTLPPTETGQQGRALTLDGHSVTLPGRRSSPAASGREIVRHRSDAAGVTAVPQAGG